MDELGVGRGGVGGQPGELSGVGHPGLVEDHDRPGEEAGLAVAAQEQARQGVLLGQVGFHGGQPLDRGRNRGIALLQATGVSFASAHRHIHNKISTSHNVSVAQLGHHSLINERLIFCM